MKTRRQFLSESGLYLASGLVMGNLPFATAFAQGKKRPVFVHLTAQGGAHSLLGLNPLLLNDLYNRTLDPVPKRDSELYPAYNDEQLIKTPHHLLAEAAAPLVSVSGDISIINGVMMLADQPLHEPNELFMNSGDEDGRDAIFAAQLARQADQSIFGIAKRSFRLNDDSKGIPLNDLSSSTQLMNKVKLMVAHAKHSKNASSLERTKSEFEEINRRFARLESVKSTINRYDQSSSWINDLVPGLAADLVNYGFIDLTGFGFSVDTHSNHDMGQKQAQRDIFTQIANFITAAKSVQEADGSTLFDRMVIMYTTDFARTSWAESRDGTGHNPHNNSVLLSGGLLKTGINLGQSTVIPSSRTTRDTGSDGRSRLQALPYDFNTFNPLSYEDGLKFVDVVAARKASSDGQEKIDYIFPGNIMKTIALAMGLEAQGKLNKYNSLSPLLKRG